MYLAPPGKQAGTGGQYSSMHVTSTDRHSSPSAQVTLSHGSRHSHDGQRVSGSRTKPYSHPILQVKSRHSSELRKLKSKFVHSVKVQTFTILHTTYSWHEFNETLWPRDRGISVPNPSTHQHSSISTSTRPWFVNGFFSLESVFVLPRSRL